MMKANALFGVLGAIASVTASDPVAAHHSFAMFDTNKNLIIRGTVKDWVWANPHSWLYVTVTRADGSTVDWALECSSPNMMIRWGWNASDIQVGDKLTVNVHPARDGKSKASVFAVFLANGHVLADPMGRRAVSGDDLANGPPSLPALPVGEEYR